MNIFKWYVDNSQKTIDEVRAPHPDKDIHNLRLILYSIQPYSKWWRWGFIRSLKRAIQALEKENSKNG